jgi:hypothetical protein
MLARYLIIFLILPFNLLLGQRIIYNERPFPEIEITLDTFFTENSFNNGKAIRINNVFLPGEAGKPDLPVISKLMSVPENAVINFIIKEKESYVIKNIDISPAPKIVQIPGNLEYNKDRELYSRNKLYPENIARSGVITSIREINIAQIGITPFQYNPVTKELTVYKKLKIEVRISGGTKYFDERLRNPYFDALIGNQILNPGVLKENDNTTNRNRLQLRSIVTRSDLRAMTGLINSEYIIITPNGQEFQKWADSIKNFRTAQGIKTSVFTLNEIGGNTYTAIKNFIQTAYNQWEIPPVAVLLLGDYGTNPDNSIISPIYNNYHISDNMYGDMNNDGLPDIIVSRIPAQNENDLSNIISKILNYERNPPTSASYYNQPITATGWETTNWFQICTEATGGFLKYQLGKNPVRINEVYAGNPLTDPWSTAPNTLTIINYFGPNGLNYIPATPQQLGGFTGGTPQMILNAINSGAFFLLHRDHGSITGWGQPVFNTTYIDQLQNTLPVTVFSINCQNGKFDWTGGDCFAERFLKHTYNGNPSGAVSVVSAVEVSYPFLNDIFTWGMIDNLWNNFMPGFSTTFISPFLMPAFANAAGKYFLHSSTWTNDSVNRIETYFLFHHFGDAFFNMSFNPPSNIAITHPNTIYAGEKTFSVQTESGTRVALSKPDELLGSAISAGGTLNIPVSGSQMENDTLKIVATKQNSNRYENKVITLPNPNAYLVMTNVTINDNPPNGNGNGMPDYAETNLLGFRIRNYGFQPANNIGASLSTTSNWITLIDSTENIPSVPARDSLLVSDIFRYYIKNNIPDTVKIKFKLSLSSSKGIWEYNFEFTAHASLIKRGTIKVIDSTYNPNGKIDPGDTAVIKFPVHNLGSSQGRNISVKYFTYSNYLTFQSDSIVYGNINPHDSLIKYFKFFISAGTPIQTEIKLYSRTYSPVQNLIILDSHIVTIGPDIIVNIGNGEISCGYPFFGNSDAKTEILYTAEEIISAGGFSGYITKIGFNIRTFHPLNNFQNFEFRFKFSNATNITGFTSDNWSVIYGGQLSIQSLGWHYFVLQNIIWWNGTSNIQIQICFDNPVATGAAATVFGTSYPGKTFIAYYDDPYGSGCDFVSGVARSNRPNLSLAINESVGIKNINSEIPDNFILYQNYPNPFNSTTNFKFEIAKQCFAVIKVFDILGREVVTLVNDELKPGIYEIDFNAENLSSGIYFYRLTAGDFTDTKRMVLLR